MTAKLHKADRGLALGFLLWASLSLVTLIDAQNQAQPRSANPAGPDASKGVWVVRFEPVDGFSPRTPAEFLGRIHVYSGQNGQIGYLRTKKQGSKLVGSFLADDADQLKAALNSVPGIQVTSVEKLTAETLAAYEAAPQESLIDFEHLDAAQGVWAISFEPIGNFSPKTPAEFLSRIQKHASCYTGQNGEIGYFRTTKKGNKLTGSFLAYDTNQLKAQLDKVPGLRVTSLEKLTPETLAAYEAAPQESLMDFEHLDAAQGVWVVRFEPVAGFSPKTPAEFLGKIHVYSGQDGQIGYFRTKKEGDKLAASFLAYDGQLLRTALSKIPEIKVTSVEKLTAETLAAYEASPQESLE